MAGTQRRVGVSVLQTLENPAELLRPTMRGWLHAVAALFSVAAGVALVAVAPAGRTRAGVSIFAVALALTFATSALYHRVRWSPSACRRMARLDHSMIFLLIAATYTPFAVLAMSPPVARAVLAGVWGGALVGVAARNLWRQPPPVVMVALYLALGWVAAFVFPDILHRAGAGPLSMLIVGGGLYTVGAFVYALRRPSPLPGIFGYHEVFHLCTVLAAACHYVALFSMLDGAVVPA